MFLTDELLWHWNSQQIATTLKVNKSKQIDQQLLNVIDVTRYRETEQLEKAFYVCLLFLLMYE